MEWILIPAIAFGGSLLTFFSGFGLGTILLPIFMVWYGVDVAITMTALVHLANSVFKLALMRAWVDQKTLVQFGLIAVLFAILGGWTLVQIHQMPVAFTYSFMGRIFEVSFVRLIISVLIIVFVLIEGFPLILPQQFNSGFLWVGGALSGFFGGLSGHQGALRSLFLIQAGLSKEAFIATSSAIALLVDIGRMTVYIPSILGKADQMNWLLILISIVFAFAGAVVGKVTLKKMTLAFVQKTVAFLLIVLAVLMGAGIV